MIREWIPLAVAATLLSALVSAFVASIISKRALRAQAWADLVRRIDQTTMIGIQYPYVEDENFCGSWPPPGAPEEPYQRYDNYCCLVFNLLEDLYGHFKGRAARIEERFGAREMIVRHRRWWRDPQVSPLNRAGYGDGFCGYVEATITDAERKEKCGA
jgi:hypothetical protein